MGLFKRKTTIGRSSLSQEDIDRIIDLQDPYRTDYSYVRSRSYRKDGSEIYENPRMFRLPLNYYKRKWAMEDAWNRGALVYLAFYIMDFCRRAARNPSTTFKGIYRALYYFFHGFLSQDGRSFLDLSTLSHDRTDITTLSDSSGLSSDFLYQQELTSRWQLLTRFFYRITRTVIYIFTLGYYPRSYSKDVYVEDIRLSKEIIQPSSTSAAGSVGANVEQFRHRMELRRTDASVEGSFYKKAGKLFSSLLPLLCVILLGFIIGKWLLTPRGEGLDIGKQLSSLRSTWVLSNLGEAADTLSAFVRSFFKTISDLPSLIWDNILPVLNLCRIKLGVPFRSLCRILLYGSLKRQDYPPKGDETVISKTVEEDDHMQKDFDLHRSLSEKDSWANQLSELKRERVLNQEQFEELRRSIDQIHSPFPIPSTDVNERAADRGALDEEALFQRIETSVLKKLPSLSLRVSGQSGESVNSYLNSKLGKLTEEMRELVESRMKVLGKDAQEAYDTLSNEIASLGADIAVLRNDNDALNQERNARLAEMIRSITDRDIQEGENLKALLKVEIERIVRENVIKDLDIRLAGLVENTEHALKERLLQELRTIVSEALVKKEAAWLLAEGGCCDNKQVGERKVFADSEYANIKQLIWEELKKYDADKTGKVDYALESSGASVLSTRCTEAYKQKSRVESIFGFPLWYSSYSPRQVIQHRASFASGECWAFRGIGYLAIKLAYPVYVTEISYEHLPLSLHPDGNTRSAPRHFQIWSLRNVDALDAKFLIGEYEYNNTGEALQTFIAQHIPHDPSPIVELIVLSNWGADYTCLYRLRVHGRKPANGTIEPPPEVDHSVREETVKKTEPLDLTNVRNRV